MADNLAVASPNYDWELLPGEREVNGPRAAGHVEPGYAMPGGRLLLTNMRLIWIPSALARRAASKSVEVRLDLTAIAQVDIAPRRPLDFVGGMRRRVRVRLHDGSEHQFMISLGLAAPYAARLQALVADAATKSGAAAQVPD
jgi:hypothetical protein